MSNSIADAFKKLHVSPDASPSEHEQIFTISYEYLTKVKNYQDLKAFKNCLVALINLDKYHKAYEIIKHVSKDLVGTTKMEVGYVYYKLGHVNELFELYKDNTTDSEVEQIGWNHILAQTYYKVGKYEQAYELYEKLLDSNKFDNPLDLIINQAAVVSQENILGAGRSANIDKDDNYDLLFNQALVELSNNNLSKSLQLLDQAHNLCSSNTEWSKQDLLGELLPIKLTIAYVYQLLGDSEKSLTILNEINQDIDLVNDVMIKLIIKNNLYSLKDDYKVGLVERSLDYQPHLQKLQQKLTKWQYQIVLKNNIMLNYTSGTLSKSQVDNLFIKRYLEDFPGDFFPVAYRILLKLDISFKDLHSGSQLKSIGKKLVKYIKDAEAHYKQVAVLLLVYVHARTSKFDQPLPFLEALVHDELSEEKLTPGVVGTLINVYEETRSTSKLSQLLTKLTDRFIATSQEVYSDMFYFDCAKFIAFKALNQGQHEQAMKLFQYLSTIDGNDHLIESILSNSNVDLLPITELSSSEPIDEILNVDINELIPTKNQTKTITKTVNKVTKKKKAPKFGPSKILKPEGEFTVDKERWLPLKLRSYYKPTKKDKKRNTGQGSVEHSVSSSAPAATHSSSSNKKKKKKGKK